MLRVRKDWMVNYQPQLKLKKMWICAVRDIVSDRNEKCSLFKRDAIQWVSLFLCRWKWIKDISVPAS